MCVSLKTEEGPLKCEASAELKGSTRGGFRPSLPPRPPLPSSPALIPVLVRNQSLGSRLRPVPLPAVCPGAIETPWPGGEAAYAA